MPRCCTYCGEELEDDSEDCPTCHGGKVADPWLRRFVDGTLPPPGVDLVIDVQNHEGEEPSAPADSRAGGEAADERSKS